MAAVSAVVYAIAGLATYVVATQIDLGVTIRTTVAIVVASLVLTFAGIVVGARFPRAAAILMQAWAVVTVVVVCGALAALIASGAWVFAGRGEHPSPTVEAIAGAITTILAAVGGLTTSGAGKLTPAQLSKAVIQRRYGGRFSEMPPGQPKLDAYYAVQRESFGATKGGPLAGWGLRSTARRLALIRAGI
jgi:hypothetical protein